MPKIKKITGRQILDSRGQPTIETRVELDNGISSIASVPSGASTGIHEAVELRDNDKNNFHGKSVFKAVNTVNSRLNNLLKGISVTDQETIDKAMISRDATSDKSRFGANSILSVSLSCARSASLTLNLPLYKYLAQLYKGSKSDHQVIPLFNVINGGLHAQGGMSFQEFFIIPHCDDFAACLQTGSELYFSLKKILLSMGKNTNVGDEGGFAPRFEQNESVLQLLQNLTGSLKVGLGLDVAASSFFKKGIYQPEEKPLSTAEYLKYILSLNRKYHLEVLEDPLSEDDWENWPGLNSQLQYPTRLIGDDLLVTNKTRLQKAIEEKACNGILVKLNQIGTLSETLEVVKIARQANFTVVISHRSGETNDDFIADMAVAVGADYVKFGAPARGERVAKYNRLLAIYGSDFSR